jgi:hypothetical protein
MVDGGKLEGVELVGTNRACAEVRFGECMNLRIVTSS